MSYWSWGKTVSFAIIYFFILLVTWKFRIGDIPMKWKMLTTITAPIAVGLLLYIKEPK